MPCTVVGMCEVCVKYGTTDYMSIYCCSQAPSNSMYGGRHTVTLIPGDGIGPELAACVKEVFRCVCRALVGTIDTCATLLAFTLYV